MSMNTEILQFLDGTLAPDSEAELLHRLSVSPERRDLLRSFINQQVLFQRDRNSIAVPYAAEQKLWAQLGTMMSPLMENAAAPAAAAIETAATTASRTGIFNSVFSAASVAVICLLLGLGAGFYAGKNSNTNSLITNAPAMQTGSPSLTTNENLGNIAPTGSISNKANVRNNHPMGESQNIFAPIPGAPLENNVPQNINNENIANADNTNNINGDAIANSALPEISMVVPKQIGENNFNAPLVRDPNQYWEHSPFSNDDQMVQKTFLQKWEFYFNEGIGKQFPNNAATNVSMPVITNSSISALFQPFANSSGGLSRFWGGGSFGTANVTMKKFRIAQKDPLDPKSGYEMVSDLVHVQTTYLGGLLQYRIPVSRKVAFTVAGTAAGSSAGTILGGEIGAHYDATSDVGIVVGVRGTHLSYNVDAQQQQVIAQGITSFGVTAAAQTTQPSYNFEISSGIYFHF
jgi:hypothetical protein